MATDASVHSDRALQPRRSRIRRPGWRKGLLTVHVVTAVAILGTDIALLTLAAAGATGWAPRSIYPAMHLVAANVLVPLVLAGLVTGIAQAVLGGWGLFRHWWVTVKLAVTALGAVLAVAVLTPGLGKAAAAATGAGAAGFLSGQRQTVYAVVLAVQCALLVLLATLGVFKPRGRIRRGH